MCSVNGRFVINVGFWQDKWKKLEEIYLYPRSMEPMFHFWLSMSAASLIKLYILVTICRMMMTIIIIILISIIELLDLKCSHSAPSQNLWVHSKEQVTESMIHDRGTILQNSLHGIILWLQKPRLNNHMIIDKKFWKCRLTPASFPEG